MLKEGITYTGEVLSVQENADSFNKQGGGKSHCHYLRIVIPTLANHVADAQFCTDRDVLTEFQAGDIIKFSPTRLTKNRWTIRFTEKTIGSVKPHTQANAIESDGGDGYRNPVVAGTAMDRAMYNAAHFLQMKGNVSDEQLIALTLKLYRLYLNPVQHGTGD